MKHRLFIFSIFIIYIALMTFIMINQELTIAPGRYLFILLLGGLLVKRSRNFIFDWAHFVFILISYDFLRNFATILAPQAEHWQIALDQQLFHTIPSAFLQSHLFHPTQLAWYDYLATTLYLLHFILFPSFAFLLWLQNRQYFREFATGLTVLSYAAWITYLLFPTIPPWMAAQDGYLQGVYKIMDLTLKATPGSLNFPAAYAHLNPNPTAAFPSMHTAYPFLIFLFSLRYFKLKALLFLPYVLGIWFSIIYLGEHYITDLLGGVVFTIFAYVVSIEILHRNNWQNIFRKFKKSLVVANS